MTKSSDTTPDDLETPDAAAGASPADPDPAAGDRRTVHDLWLSGTESPRQLGPFTDEGAQEMLPEESDRILSSQLGTIVEDDFEGLAGSDDDELQTITTGVRITDGQ